MVSRNDADYRVLELCGVLNSTLWGLSLRPVSFGMNHRVDLESSPEDAGRVRTGLKSLDFRRGTHNTGTKGEGCDGRLVSDVRSVRPSVTHTGNISHLLTPGLSPSDSGRQCTGCEMGFRGPGRDHDRDDSVLESRTPYWGS